MFPNRAITTTARRLFPAGALAAGLVLALSPLQQSFADPLDLTTRPVPLFREDASRDRVGDLVWRGGLDLVSADPRFGGLSALAVRPDGEELTVISDNGFWIKLKPAYSGGNLTGIAAAELGVLADMNGHPLESRDMRDAESLAIGVDGALIVSFERNHRIWAYLPGEVLPRRIPEPLEIADAPSNGGMEAMTLLANGKLFIVTEDFGNDDNVIGWVSDRSGWSVVTVRVSGSFKPTGATTLPDGDVLLLERRFGLRGGVGVRIRRIAAATIQAGAVRDGPEIARLDGGATFDNMEGIGNWTDAEGRTFVYIVSDDNFSALQRSYLMMFELRPE